ncbi:LOW QUALITY PROTEIN: nuclear envelope pore membrane protein POM 121C [Phyllostomus discolor]|uniref:LOW QUALITY PROTEIN: nuclear envelope pore membrane protein POM 121C n=1 Tax=Phyllostomus discolor TaxID=89673 RepID=A0A6J2MRC7_9CHIR|nr:LOW QUALITY PROTEIN: nuclear envelope pore membrane protein POM 121C [Phyllostomus discolor]
MSPAATAPGGCERRRPIASVRDGRGRGWGCGWAALLGLSLFGLVLYLVPAAAALAWLAVGATAAWWGLSREPRGSRAFSSLVRNARRQRTLLASPPAKSAVNGNLLEPRTLLKGPDPAELLLVGSYQGKPGPPQSARVPEATDLRERPGGRPPTRTTLLAYSAQHVHHVHSSPPTFLLSPSRRPSHRDCGTLSNRFLITPRRRYPIQQAQYSSLGVLPTVSWNGYHKKAVLSPHNSKMVCSPVTVRIAPPDSKLTRSPIPEQLMTSTLSSTSSNAPDPCAKETVLSALKERKKRTVEEEEQILLMARKNKRRRHDSSGSGQSAFEPLVANGVPASFVPKPGSLKRGLTSQSSDDYLNKRSRTSSVSSMTSTYTGGIPSSSRNAITSSYSSTRGFSQLWKRSGPSSSPFSSPASSRSQTPERPAKKIREEELSHHSSSSAPLVADKESQGEKVTDTTAWKKQNLQNSPSTPGSSGQRKRKIQLLPAKRGDQLTLPPPPQLGYSVTAEDLDLEKKASLRWFNKVLEDKTDAASSSVTENPPTTQPSFTLTLPTAVAAPSPTSLPASSTNPLLESLKKMQNSPGLPSFPDDSAGVASTVAHSPPKTPSLLGPLGTSQSAPFPGTTSDSKPTVTFLGLTPASSTIPVTDTTKSPLSPQTETSAPSQAPSAPSPTPKQSILFGMLSTPPANLSASTAPAVSSASPMFKPIFAVPPKSENEGPLPSSSSKVTTAASSSSALSTSTSTSPVSFKPIFGSLGPPTPVPLSTPFSFNQTTSPATTTSAPHFTGQASATSAVAGVTTANTSADSASKPAFGFGVSDVTSSMSSVTSTTPSTSQPFLFGNPPASGASFTPATGSIFQFSKLPAMPTSATTTTTTAATTTSFSQSLSSVVQTVASGSTASFSGFGNTLTTSAPVTTSQPTLTFSNTTTPAFNIPFSSSSRAPLPSYPGANPQPTFGPTDTQQQGTSKPPLAPSFGNSFTFGSSAAPAPTATLAPTPTHTAFGNTAQSAFGGLKPAASVFGVPASTQPAFGSTTAVFSFGAATSSGFGATTQTTSSGTSSSMFGSTAPAPFTFGSLAPPAGSGGFGINVATPGTSSTSGAFSFGGGQGGTTGSTAPFGGGLSQNTLGAPSQSTPFAFNAAGTPESKPVFGGTSTPTFGQNTPAPGVGTSGSSLSFGASSTPTQGFVGVGPFGSATPSFSIGAGSKTPGARQRLQARRQHTRKK